MLTRAQLFKYGFLMRCAEEMLTDAQIDERVNVCMTKQANMDPAGALARILPGLAGLGVTLPLVGGVGLGVTGGAVAAHMMNTDVDPQELRRRELLGQLRMQTQRMRALQQISAKG